MSIALAAAKIAAGRKRRRLIEIREEINRLVGTHTAEAYERISALQEEAARIAEEITNA